MFVFGLNAPNPTTASGPRPDTSNIKDPNAIFMGLGAASRHDRSFPKNELTDGPAFDRFRLASFRPPQAHSLRAVGEKGLLVKPVEATSTRNLLTMRWKSIIQVFKGQLEVRGFPRSDRNRRAIAQGGFAGRVGR